MFWTRLWGHGLLRMTAGRRRLRLTVRVGFRGGFEVGPIQRGAGSCGQRGRGRACLDMDTGEQGRRYGHRTGFQIRVSLRWLLLLLLLLRLWL